MEGYDRHQLQLVDDNPAVSSQATSTCQNESQTTWFDYKRVFESIGNNKPLDLEGGPTVPKISQLCFFVNHDVQKRLWRTLRIVHKLTRWNIIQVRPGSRDRKNLVRSRDRFFAYRIIGCPKDRFRTNLKVFRKSVVKWIILTGPRHGSRDVWSWTCIFRWFQLCRLLIRTLALIWAPSFTKECIVIGQAYFTATLIICKWGVYLIPDRTTK